MFMPPIVKMIPWLLTALSIIGVVLNIRRQRVCFLFWIASNVGWVIVDFQQGIYAQAALFLFYLGTSVWGWVEWKKPSKNVLNEEE